MGKLFGRKGEDGEEDSKRSALFGGRKKDKPDSQNPYANVTQPDAYTQAKARAGVPGYDSQTSNSSGPPAYTGGNNRGYPDEKKSASYGADRFGAQGGYGGDRYGSGNQARQSARGPGGYGGLGATPRPQDDDRNALFGNASQRVQQQQEQQMGYGQPPPYDESGSGEPPRQDYEAYGDRQLTAEEEEEEDVTATKQQMRFIKQEDVSSTRNALRLAAQAEEQGVNTLARIGAQGERIHNTEKNLDLTANHNRLASEKAKELKHLNRSMFAVSVSNPFTSGSRAEQRDRDILEKHQLEREMREQTRRNANDSDQRMQRSFKDLSRDDPNQVSRNKASLAERSRYQFEADSEDEEMENEIDSNLTALHGAAGRLNGVARAVGREVDEQNRHLERINAKSTKVDDEIALNRARLDRFH